MSPAMVEDQRNKSTFPWSCLFIFTIVPVGGNIRYLGSILTYATGDTFLFTARNHGGPIDGNRKWIMECLDGEGLVTLQDFQDDFERLQAAACRFLFAYKPPSAGLYPYYPSCHVRNATNQFHCFDPKSSTRTMNTFVTGIWDNDFTWFTHRPGADDIQPYKCCKTPEGYYIDYISCYYMPTHDQYGEFYDALLHQVIVQCGTGYVITGISKKINPSTKLYNADWIQCCRIGYGAPLAVSPPIIYGRGRIPVHVARDNILPPPISSQYAAQYRSAEKGNCDISSKPQLNFTYNPRNPCPWNDRYKPVEYYTVETT